MSPPRDYGPIQLAGHLGLAAWQLDRARAAELIPGPDRADRRWSGAVVDHLAARVDGIRAAVGTIPDLGASRAAALLAERFGVDVDPDVLPELARMGLVPVAGEYHDHALYDGRALEAFTDRAALDQARVQGRLHTRAAAAAHLQIRPADVDHLVRAGLLTPVAWVHSSRQSRRARPAVALFRYGDLEALLRPDEPAGPPAPPGAGTAGAGVDWDVVRATPAGRRSPLADLPTHPAGPALEDPAADHRKD